MNRNQIIIEILEKLEEYLKLYGYEYQYNLWDILKFPTALSRSANMNKYVKLSEMLLGEQASGLGQVSPGYESERLYKDRAAGVASITPEHEVGQGTLGLGYKRPAKKPVTRREFPDEQMPEKYVNRLEEIQKTQKAGARDKINSRGRLLKLIGLVLGAPKPTARMDPDK